MTNTHTHTHPIHTHSAFAPLCCYRIPKHVWLPLKLFSFPGLNTKSCFHISFYSSPGDLLNKIQAFIFPSQELKKEKSPGVSPAWILSRLDNEKFKHYGLQSFFKTNKTRTAWWALSWLTWLKSFSFFSLFLFPFPSSSTYSSKVCKSCCTWDPTDSTHLSVWNVNSKLSRNSAWVVKSMPRTAETAFKRQFQGHGEHRRNGNKRIRTKLEIKLRRLNGRKLGARRDKRIPGSYGRCGVGADGGGIAQDGVGNVLGIHLASILTCHFPNRINQWHAFVL